MHGYFQGVLVHTTAWAQQVGGRGFKIDYTCYTFLEAANQCPLLPPPLPTHTFRGTVRVGPPLLLPRPFYDIRCQELKQRCKALKKRLLRKQIVLLSVPVAVIVQWLVPFVVAEVTQVRILVTARLNFFFNFSTFSETKPDWTPTKHAAAAKTI